MSRCTLIWALMLALVAARPAAAAEFTVETTDDAVTVKLNGELFTRYLTNNGPKPILWPLIGPNGKPITRGYPMRPATPEERDDHIHHRSFWFTHGDVNGIDFWAETEGHGRIAHREFLKVEGGDQAVIATRNDWIGPDGTKVCSDIRWFRFGADGDTRWIDCDITVFAEYGEVTFGDTKEGAFGVRLAGGMKVDAKLGGRIVNSRGQTDKDAWGKPAEWVDYYGPVDGDIVGVAIMNHPTSLRFPTHWHVRTYGLFTANPFGLRNFSGSSDADGALKLTKGEHFVLRHRVYLHKGDTAGGKVAEAYETYRARVID